MREQPTSPSPNLPEKINLTLKVAIIFNATGQPAKGEAIDRIAEAGVIDEVKAVEEALRQLNIQFRTIPVKDDIVDLISDLREYDPGVVINLCEGVFGESHLEMTIPCLLELLRTPYTGSSSLALGLCQNKGLAKDVLTANGIPTPKYQVILSGEEEISGLSFPLMVKPLREDASIGISKESVVRGEAELKARVNYIRENYHQPALVEEYIEGRELNVAILGNDPPQVLPISEILFLNKGTDQPKLVDYHAKWVEESDAYKSTKPVCPAHLSPHFRDLVASTALKAYRVLGCRDYARIDIRLRDGAPYVLEANPNPDISPEVGFHRSLKAAGIAYEDFIRRLINFALNRV